MTQRAIPPRRSPGIAILSRGTFVVMLAAVVSMGGGLAHSSEIACICSLNEIPGDPGTHRLLKVPLNIRDGILVEAAPSSKKRQIFLLQTHGGDIAWLAVSDTDTGPVQNTYDFGATEFLIAADKGLFKVRVNGSGVGLEAFSAERTGAVHASSQVRGVGLLVATDNGLFLVRKVNGQLRMDAPRTQLPEVPKGTRIGIEELPDLKWLIDFHTGEYFLAQIDRDTLVLGKATVRNNGFGGVWGQVRDVKGLGVLINDPSTGISLVRMVNGSAVIDSVGDQVVAQIRDARWVPEVGLFIDTGYTTLLARLGQSNISVELAARTRTGIPRIVHDLPQIGGKLLATSTGLFVATTANGQSRVEPVSNDDTIADIEEMPREGVVLATAKGLELVTISGGKVAEPKLLENPPRPREYNKVASAASATLIDTQSGYYSSNTFGPNKGVQMIYPHGFTSSRPESREPQIPGPIGERKISWLRALGNDSWLGVGDDTVVLLRRIEKEFQLSLVGAQNIGLLYSTSDLPGVGYLIAASNGLFLIGTNENFATLSQLSKSAMHIVGAVQTVEQQRWLVASDSGLHFLHPKSQGSAVDSALRDNEGGWSLDSVGAASMGRVNDIHPLGKLGWLAGTDQGLYLVRYDNRSLTTSLMSKGAGGEVDDLQEIGTAGWLMTVGGRMMVAIRTPLLKAIVKPLGGNLYGNPPDTDLDSPIDFSVEHLCAAVLQRAGLTAELTSPTNRTTVLESSRIGNFSEHAGKVIFTARLPVHVPGTWTLQFVLQRDAARQLIGQPMRITFSSDQTFRQRLETLGVWIGFVTALANILLFVAARRSPFAWRLATDDSFGTAIVRLATLALSHLSWAQLWILDLYFVAAKRRRQERSPFLALPVTRSDGVPVPSEELLSGSWKRRRIWIQGNSGMGKSALFRHLMEKHFQDSQSSFEAHKKWGCVFVPFSARDFAMGGDDEIKPDWVIDAVRTTLSQKELTFEDDKLLRRMLRTGAIGVVIDGVHEAGRAKAVEAFASTYAAAPMLVTSQEPGSQQFENYSLPPDMREFASKLLRVYLSAEDADVVTQRIVTSGLNDSIRSGYDIRLIIDIVRDDPRGAPLPPSRVGLYEAVVRTGWPNGQPDAVQQQLDRTAAAAWRAVSERKPNEDKRRFFPVADLSADLLDAIADAPERYGKPVRLMRRVGKAFEFVHDQMHAYLAARWFTQSGFTSQELEKMTAASSIWADSAPARRTLWSFVAALLDDDRLLSLWARVEEQADWDILRRELKNEANTRGLPAPG